MTAKCNRCGGDCAAPYWSAPFRAYAGARPLCFRRKYVNHPASAPRVFTDLGAFGAAAPFADGLTWRATGMHGLHILNSAVVLSEGQPVGHLSHEDFTTWVRPDFRGRGLGRKMLAYKFRHGFNTCAARELEVGRWRYSAAVRLVAEAFRIGVQWAAQEGEQVPGEVLSTYMEETEVWIMASEERQRQREERKDFGALKAAAAKASKEGTPTWVVDGKLSTVSPRSARKAARVKAAKKAAKAAAPANA